MRTAVRFITWIYISRDIPRKPIRLSPGNETLLNGGSAHADFPIFGIFVEKHAVRIEKGHLILFLLIDKGKGKEIHVLQGFVILALTVTDITRVNKRELI